MPKKNYIYDPTAIHQHTVGMQLQYCYRDNDSCKRSYIQTYTQLHTIHEILSRLAQQ